MKINMTAIKVQFIITLIACSLSHTLNGMEQRQGPAKKPTNILTILNYYQQPPGLIIAQSTTIFRPQAIKKLPTLVALVAYTPTLKNTITLPSTRKGPFKTKKQKLHAAAKKGDLNSIRSLLQKHHPSQFFPLEMIRLDIDAACTSDGRTALHIAAENDHEKIVDYLIGQHANVNVHDENYETPLDRAVVKGAINSIRSLTLNNAKFDTTLIQHPSIRINKKLTVTLKKQLKKNIKKDTSRCAICQETPKEMLKKHGGHLNYQLTQCCTNFICTTDLINLLNQKKSSCPYCREQWIGDESDSETEFSEEY